MSFLFSGSAEFGARLPGAFPCAPDAVFTAFTPDIVLFCATEPAGSTPEVLGPAPGGTFSWLMVGPAPLIFGMPWLGFVTWIEEMPGTV